MQFYDESQPIASYKLMIYFCLRNTLTWLSLHVQTVEFDLIRTKMYGSHADRELGSSQLLTSIEAHRGNMCLRSCVFDLSVLYCSANP